MTAKTGWEGQCACARPGWGSPLRGTGGGDNTAAGRGNRSPASLLPSGGLML